MTKEQVKQLFEAVQNSNMEVILKLIEDTDFSQRLQTTFSRQSAEEEMNKMQVELLKVILKQMQTSGEYEYFETLGLQEENQSDFIEIVQYAEISTETAKRYLEKLGDSSDRCRIIKATRNLEFIRKCLEDESLELEIDEKSDLICLIGDSEYTKHFVEENDSKLFLGDKIKLIQATKDPEYIKQCIETDRFGIRGLSLASLIVATGDVQYIKQSIESDKFLFSTPQKTSLVVATKDANYIQKYIAEQRELLPENEKIKLIVASRRFKIYKKMHRRWNDRVIRRQNCSNSINS